MLIGLAALAILIIVHEFGHFIFAKKLGVTVLKFSIGIGPRIYGRVVNGTEYVLAAIPIGGFVKMVGEEPEATDEVVDRTGSFADASLWRRTAIVAAGPMFNMIFAFLVLVGIFRVYGDIGLSELPQIGRLRQDMPAAAAGLLSGDLVQRVNGREIKTWKELSESIRSSKGSSLEVEFKRGEELRTVQIQPREQDEKSLFGEVTGKAYLIGIEPTEVRTEIGLGKSVVRGAQQTLFLSETIVLGLVKMIQGKISRNDIGGPLMIMQAAGESAKVGLESFLQLLALLSVNLGVLNFLPVPVLDGGHLFFFAIEAIRRRPLELRHREIAQQVGVALLVGLMAFAFYNDIARFFRGPG